MCVRRSTAWAMHGLQVILPSYRWSRAMPRAISGVCSLPPRACPDAASLMASGVGRTSRGAAGLCWLILMKGSAKRWLMFKADCPHFQANSPGILHPD
mmetsp:Transcript_70217/g.203596  ORF Transcript_70217/g.203596 Transcript_70217/m.203596 type:complete len:98 (+) Transcript_70217:666-959(+)